MDSLFLPVVPPIDGVVHSLNSLGTRRDSVPLDPAGLQPPSPLCPGVCSQRLSPEAPPFPPSTSRLFQRIRGTTAVVIASGLHWYLKCWCGAHISWDKTGGSQLASIPSVGRLPQVKDAGVIIKRRVPWNIQLFLCLVGLAQMGERGGLDCFARNQSASCIHWSISHMAESIHGL